MARVYFDDGSWIDTTDDGTTYAANTAGVVVSKLEADGDYFRAPGYWTDAREAAKLEAYVPAPNGDTRPWWERVAEYGLTRAIDNQFGPPAANKTTAPATFAGQNGKTYSQVGSTSGSASSSGGIGQILVLAAAAFAFLG